MNEKQQAFMDELQRVLKKYDARLVAYSEHNEFSDITDISIDVEFNDDTRDVLCGQWINQHDWEAK